jgi:predicted nucleic acid-binding Zn ribbon protein
MHPIGSAVPGAIAELLRGAPMSPGKVEFAWKTAVGPAFGKVTAVRLEGKTLFVDAATSHWTREIRRSSVIVLRRLQTLLGDNVITELTVRTR